MGDALVFGSVPGVVRVRGLIGEHGDRLVEVAVGRRSGDAVVAGQRCRIGVLAEPAQAKHRLPEAGQRPGVRAGAAAAFGLQESAEVLGQFAGTSSVAR